MKYKAITLFALLFTPVFHCSAQKIYRDVQQSKQEIKSGNYERLLLPVVGKDEFAFAYMADGKYGQEIVYYYANESNNVYKVVYIPTDPEQAWRRMKDLKYVLPADQFMTSTSGTLSGTVYGYNTSYYDGWAFYKYGEYIVEGKRLFCFVVLLDQKP